MPDLFLSKAKVLFPNFFLLDLDQEIYRAAFFCFFYAIFLGRYSFPSSNCRLKSLLSLRLRLAALRLLPSVVELRTKVLVVAARYFFGGLRCGFALRRYVSQLAVRSALRKKTSFLLGLRLCRTAAHR
ncbi:hypothetical protein [Saprospira grandis]|uniref:hypothetical protein n=1 Tax=Saprospira grandis TaxID=1008 RepID=UPI0022DE2C65|nr:hypothetical protein [Saprospira grandis]WBM74905.1 hypothetical protein OP864_01440 [Saprospira grandis]